jgi:hypothetical protein
MTKAERFQDRREGCESTLEKTQVLKTYHFTVALPPLFLPPLSAPVDFPHFGQSLFPW